MTSLDGRVRPGSEGPDDVPAAEAHDTTGRDGAGAGSAGAGSAGAGSAVAGSAVAGAEAATVRRARPSRAAAVGADPASGDPSPAGSAPPPSPAPPPPPSPAPPPAEPVRRPVPPTFPSPGQPPPAVARRAGRHARPEVQDAHTPPDGYRPRHAASDVETEQFASVSATGPGGSGPAPPAVLAAAPAPAPPSVPARVLTEAEAPGSERVRVVLAERRAPTRAVRTVAEIEQQTETGELLLGNLLRAQLTLGLRLGAVAVLLLGALPVLFLVLPGLGGISVLGVRVPWLLLGLAPYPVMLLLAWLYTRTAERNELDFADNVED